MVHKTYHISQEGTTLAACCKNQVCANSECQVMRATKVHTCGLSVWTLLYISLLVSRIF